MRLIFQGSDDARDIPGVGTVRRGEPFDCPDELAGRHPSKRWLDLQLVEIPAAVAALDHARRVALIDELIDEDAGAGLLAQWPVFVHAPIPAPKATPKADPTGGDQ